MSLIQFFLAVLATGFVLGAGFGFYIGRGGDGMTDPWAKLPDKPKPFVEGQAEAITQTAIATYHYLNDDPKFAAVKFDGHQMVDLTPTTQLVFECCKCGVIHDPETVSFQTLVDTGKAAGWTIKFRDAGYDAYCKDHSP